MEGCCRVVTSANGLCGAGPFLKWRADVSWETDFKQTGDMCRYTHTRTDKTVHYKTWEGKPNFAPTQHFLWAQHKERGCVYPLCVSWSGNGLMVLSTAVPKANCTTLVRDVERKKASHRAVSFCKRHPSFTLSSGLCQKAQTTVRILYFLLSCPFPPFSPSFFFPSDKTTHPYLVMKCGGCLLGQKELE